MENQPRKQTEEISLYELWNILVKRKITVIVIFFITLAAAAVLSFASPRIYRSEAVLSIYENGVIEKASGTIIAGDLPLFVGEINSENIATMLPKTHSSIIDLRLKPIKGSLDKMEVMIEAVKADDIPRALNEFVYYVNNIDVVKSRFQEELEKLLKQSSELSSTIEYSSKMLAAYDRLLKEGRLTMVGFNPMDLNERISQIKLQKIEVDQVIQKIRSGGVYIVKHPFVPKAPVKPKVKANLILGGTAGLFMGIFFALFFEYIEKTRITTDLNKNF